MRSRINQLPKDMTKLVKNEVMQEWNDALNLNVAALYFAMMDEFKLGPERAQRVTRLVNDYIERFRDIGMSAMYEEINERFNAKGIPPEMILTVDNDVDKMYRQNKRFKEKNKVSRKEAELLQTQMFAFRDCLSKGDL